MTLQITLRKGQHKRTINNLQRLYDAMVGFQLEHNVPVSRRWLIRHFDIDTDTLYPWLKELEARGYIKFVCVNHTYGHWIVVGLSYQSDGQKFDTSTHSR